MLCVMYLRYALMNKCWSFNPDERPTFKYCLEVLVELKEKIPNVITPTMPEIGKRYINYY